MNTCVIVYAILQWNMDKKVLGTGENLFLVQFFSSENLLGRRFCLKTSFVCLFLIYLSFATLVKKTHTVV